MIEAPARPATAAGTRYAMATLLRVETEAIGRAAAESARDLIFAEVQRLERLLSRFRPDSEVSSINKAAGLRPVRVSPETFEVIERSLEFARVSGGAFDSVADGGHAGVRLDRAALSVFLPAGSSLDLGGIGKGFALDRAMEAARSSNELLGAHVDFGGQLLFWRRDGYAEPVTVAIEDPARSGALLAEFKIRENRSVSTSSQRERPGHLVDRRTGLAAQTLSSATVAAPTAIEAEAWSTALFVAGREGLAWLEGRADVEAFLF